MSERLKIIIAYLIPAAGWLVLAVLAVIVKRGE